MTDQTHKGVLLKQTREAKGLSLQTVHEATKIPFDALKAIEEGYTIRTLSSFYIKGFMKMYARYLGVDVSNVVEDYKPEQLPKTTHEKKDTSQSKIDNIISSDVFQGVLRILIFIMIALILFRFTGCIVHKVKNRSRRTVVMAPEKAKEKKAQNQKKRELAQEKTEAKASQAMVTSAVVQQPKKTKLLSPSTDKEINLTVRARKSSWLRVKADGAVVFQSVFKKGSVETWDADEEIVLSGRNINELEFELNGKVIGTFGRNDRRVRKVVVTKNGLSVKQ